MALDVGGGPEGGRARPEMNVTPLVDVVLVLLIIFMVVMPMLAEHFWVHVPRQTESAAAEDTPDPSEPPIVVTVGPDGRARINRQVFGDDELPTHLRRMLVARGERKVYFDAADEVPFERAVEVMDLARAAGGAHLAVMTEALR